MRNPFHIVEISPWPLLLSLNLVFFLIGFVSIFSNINGAYNSYIFSLICTIYVFYLWMNDIIIESILGNHSNITSKGLIWGFILFCITEIMLFFCLFWGYFHSAWNTIYLIWPPIGISIINPYSIPVLNTSLLFFGGLAGTAAHHYLLNLDSKNTKLYLGITISLTIIFFICQIFEFYSSNFDITDSVFGTTFFMLSGLHGFHILIAIIALIILYIRIYSNHISDIYFNSILLYFHILDIIWILLVLLVYIN